MSDPSETLIVPYQAYDPPIAAIAWEIAKTIYPAGVPVTGPKPGVEYHPGMRLHCLTAAFLDVYLALENRQSTTASDRES